MDKPLEKRLTPRDAAVLATALLLIGGAALVLSFQYWDSKAADSQLKSTSIFQDLALKRVELKIREYTAPQETGQPLDGGGIFEDQQTARHRPVKYLPTPNPPGRISIATSPAFYDALQEQIRSQLEVAGIPVYGGTPPEEPRKEAARPAMAGPAGNGYLSISVEVEHAPEVATFQIVCRLYRDMRLAAEADTSFEIPVATPQSRRHRVRESDFRTAVSYEVEQMIRTYITYPFSMTRDRFRPQTVQ